jgi:retron-type reverse transcriptase
MEPFSFKEIYSAENLYAAWHKAARGKSKKPAVLAFYRNLDLHLASVAEEIRLGTYAPGPYNRFVIQDPKERIISASPVRDQVVQHALMNYYDPLFERYQIFDSYACRAGKGTQKAVLRAFHFAKGQWYGPNRRSGGPGFFLKMDVRKYFDSVDHRVLKELLSRLITGKEALRLFYTIIDSSSSVFGKGLPIGNLTSQYFANHYLAVFDHYIKEKAQVKKYIRYMDDMLLFSEDKSRLKDLYAAAVSYAADNLLLKLKPAVIAPLRDGAPFLGFLVKPQGIYLQRKSKTRYKTRVAEIEHKREHGLVTELEAARRMESVTSHLLLARSRNFRNTILHGRFLGV